MQPINELEQARIAGLCLRRLRATGVEIEQTTDFGRVVETAKQMGKPYFTKQLHPDYNDFTESDAFFLLLKDTLGEFGVRDVGMLGVRCENMRPGEFASFFQRHMTRLYGKGEIEPLKPGNLPPVFHDISGRVAYIGDLFITKPHRGEKGVDKRSLLLLAFVLSNMRWSFDWLYSFVREGDAEKGRFAMYCFTRTYLCGLLWDDPPDERNDSDYLGCVSREDFTFLARRMLERPDVF